MVINNFITQDEKQEMSECIRSYRVHDVDMGNKQVRYITEQTKGFTAIYDFSNTDLTRQIARVQSDNRELGEVPPIFHEVKDRIAKALNINTDHSFVQGILLGKGGRVSKHYDAGIPGYITYKCNVVITGPKDDMLYVDKEKWAINELDLYAFEANFYKHWLDASDEERVVASYGYIIPYADLGWESDSPRVKLSDKVWHMNTG